MSEQMESAFGAKRSDGPREAPWRGVGDTTAILKARAERIARPMKDLSPVVKATHVCFRVSGDVYAIGTECVDRAFAIRRLTPIAGAPRPVRGVFSLNGRIVAAIDIGRLCGRDTAEDEPGAYGVLISGDGAECALLADAIVGLRQIAESDIERSESGVTDRVRVGLSNEGVSILSPANVLALSRAAGAHTRTRVEGGSD